MVCYPTLRVGCHSLGDDRSELVGWPTVPAWQVGDLVELDVFELVATGDCAGKCCLAAVPEHRNS